MTRRILFGAGLALALLARPLAGVWAADTVSGEVVDLACYLHDPTMKGPAHRKCAETCAKKGIPMGLLTGDGKVLLLLENHDQPKGYTDALANAAKAITVEGTQVSLGGVNAIVVDAVK